MAQPTTINGTQVFVKIGDGASPEVFTHPCLINAERGITFRSTTNDIIVPDCTTPENPAWREITKDALSVGITGTGVLDNVIATIQAYDTWWRGDTSKNVQLWLGAVGAWEGGFQLTEFEITGERNNKAIINLTLESDGVIATFSATP